MWHSLGWGGTAFTMHHSCCNVCEQCLLELCVLPASFRDRLLLGTAEVSGVGLQLSGLKTQFRSGLAEQSLLSSRAM